MTKQRLSVLAHEEKGTALLEFALASPLLIMFIFAVLQIGIVMQSYSSLREVIGWGGREAMVSYQDTSDGVYSDTTIKNMIETRAANDAHRLKASDLTVAVATTSDSVLMAKKIKIDISYAVQLAIPLWDTRALTLVESRTFYVPE